MGMERATARFFIVLEAKVLEVERVEEAAEEVVDWMNRRVVGRFFSGLEVSEDVSEEASEERRKVSGEKSRRLEWRALQIEDIPYRWVYPRDSSSLRFIFSSCCS